MLLANISEKGVQPPQPMQNLHMMRVEPCEEDLKANIMLRSGTTIGEDKGKQPAEFEWVHGALEKETRFDLECAKETFMEAKKSFSEASTSGGQEKLAE